MKPTPTIDCSAEAVNSDDRKMENISSRLMISEGGTITE